MPRPFFDWVELSSICSSIVLPIFELEGGEVLFVFICPLFLQDDEQLAYISKLETQLKEVTSQLENTTQRIDAVIREVTIPQTRYFETSHRQYLYV